MIASCGFQIPFRLLDSNAPGKALTTETFLTSRGNYSTRFTYGRFLRQVFERNSTVTRQYCGLTSFIFSLNVSRVSMINLAVDSEVRTFGQNADLYIRGNKLNDNRAGTERQRGFSAVKKAYAESTDKGKINIYRNQWNAVVGIKFVNIFSDDFLSRFPIHKVRQFSKSSSGISDGLSKALQR